ncbi:MAG TPA: malectin domain-containing carbohydrate-binding protein [Rhodospirillales bacterium]|nr:malectin domain-containing carbohydrate-binding protein [Rhodospirillales bacterium]
MPLDATFPLLIEAGSTKAYTDTQGRTWRADDGFIGGSVADRGAIEIDGTADDRIYQTERWGLSGYAAKVPNGKYIVRLHFAETYQDAAAKRVFSVKVEDRTIANLDVFAEAGGKNKALVKTLDDVTVADGELNIDFTGAGAMVNGIEVVLPWTPPTITMSGGSIQENSAAGAAVATVSAKGAATDVFSYALTNNAGGRFVIGAQTGAITVAPGATIDFETATSHGLEVSVTDAKGNVTKQSFTIQVVDVYEAPAITMSGGSIRENSAAGAAVATVSAKGAATDVFSYALTNNAGGRFVIDAQTGVISVAAGAVLDFEAAPSHGVEVAATDAKGVTTKQQFTIALLDVDESTPTPQALKLTHLLAENAPAGTFVGKLALADQGVAKPVFSLKDNDGGRFVIDANTGVISVSENADLCAETKPSHSLTALADVGSGRVVEQSFEVALADVNEPPTAIFMSAQSVQDAAAAGTLVGTASALDPDAGETFTYALVDDAQGRFTIDARSGAVSVAPGAKLDHKTAPAHRIIVKATDSAGHALTNGFTLNVRPVTTTSAQPILIEAGGTADVIDSKGRKWTADTGFIGGGVADRGAIEIAGTTDDRLYQTERWGMTGYSLPVAPGLYTVKLHFAETFATAAGARVFSVDVEGQKLTDLDIFAAVGAKTALVKTLSNVVVTDGKLDIGFTQKVGGAMVNAIEIEPLTNCPATAQ